MRKHPIHQLIIEAILDFLAKYLMMSGVKIFQPMNIKQQRLDFTFQATKVVQKKLLAFAVYWRHLDIETINRDHKKPD